MKPLFGNTFDLDGNGHVTPEEELLGISMMQKMQQEQLKAEEASVNYSAQYFLENNHPKE